MDSNIFIDDLCESTIDDIFDVNKITRTDYKVILKYFKKTIYEIYHAFKIPTLTIKSKKQIVLTDDDYKEVLMLLFPFISDWRELKNVSNVRELFTTDKYCKFYVNNSEYKHYQLLLY